MTGLKLFFFIAGILTPIVIAIFYVAKPKVKFKIPKRKKSTSRTTSTKTTRKLISKKFGPVFSKIWNFLSIILMLIIIFLLVKHSGNKSDSPKRIKNTSPKTEQVYTTKKAELFSHDYVLEKKGDSETFFFEFGHFYGFDGYGGKYYVQFFHNTNGRIWSEKPVLFGGGLPNKDYGDDVFKAVLSFYVDSVTVTVIHSTDKNLIK